jgi:hypothetical protein
MNAVNTTSGNVSVHPADNHPTLPRPPLPDHGPAQVYAEDLSIQGPPDKSEGVRLRPEQSKATGRKGVEEAKNPPKRALLID